MSTKKSVSMTSVAQPYCIARPKFEGKLAATGRDAEFHTYPGTTHWFFEKARPDAYDTLAARLAWQRMVKFLRQHISK